MQYFLILILITLSCTPPEPQNIIVQGVTSECDGPYGYDCGDCEEYEDNPSGFCFECSSDLNNDLSLDIMDVILMVGCVLSETCDECSDFNEDGSTDVLDVVDLVNVILDI